VPEHAIVGVDFSPGWDRLRRRLGVLPRLGVRRISLVHVLGGHYPAAPEVRHREHYERRLDEEAVALRTLGAEVDHQVRVGDPARELVHAASELGADLVVVGSAGHTPLRDAVLGNIAIDVVRYGPLPTLLVPLGDDIAPGGGGVVLGTDGSGAARAAEDLARRLAERLPLVVVTVVRDGDAGSALADDAGTFAVDGSRAEVLVRHGRPSEQIARVADERSADVVIVGRRGRNPVTDLFIGSTAEHLIARTRRPVLVGA